MALETSISENIPFFIFIFLILLYATYPFGLTLLTQKLQNTSLVVVYNPCRVSVYGLTCFNLYQYLKVLVIFLLTIES